ncbi:hypothetical protein [Clostridium intestinale]|uniref:Uncharacterized protein n=1 Tax=Clostridium intestinale DSM 6191 TaxID=1121320 RepID=A0A1M6AMK1_9CLOT|nr:hypothetical protein [Clostridium intestinale]SHI37675.1 hypothetical protein SAMN02745941_03706 [Clostridium intestinale DSM 6191]
MSENLFKEYDNILDFREYMLQYAEDNYDLLRDTVENNKSIVRYSTNASYLGFFCPSLVLDKITKGFTKGRLLKSIPKGKKGYVIYELDSNGKLLRIQEVNSFGTIFETYIIRKDDEEFSVTTLEGKKCSVVSSTRTIYDNDKLIRFDIMSSASIRSEIYFDDSYDSKKVHCDEYYYVPNLKGSNKSIQIGEIGSPMKLFNMIIELDEKRNVVKIEHGEFINGKTEMSYIYTK